MTAPIVTQKTAVLPSGISRSQWTVGQRVRVLLAAGTVFSLGLGFFWLQGAPVASTRPLSFHLDDISPTESGVAFVHAKPVFHPTFANVFPFLEAVSAAGCVSDVDHDGRLDLLFVTSGHEARNHFYKNVTEGSNISFERVVIDAIEDTNRDGFSTDCVFADVDNDGWEDLFVGTAAQRPRLFLNRSSEDAAFGRTFVDVTSISGLPPYMNGFAASFLDLDRDGDLDLVTSDYFRARYDANDVDGAPYVHNLRVPDSDGNGRMMPNNWGAADNGGQKHLLLNDGAGHFVEQDLTAWGLAETRFTFDIGTGDLNRDGFTDLYFANDFGPDQLYLNRGGKTFVDVKGRFPTDVGRDSFKGMNADIHDIDHDGYPEIYVTNVFHPALPEGNLLWQNRPHPSGDAFLRDFKNISADIGTKDGGWGWGAKFVDLDNDADVDLVATNGYISGDPDREYWYAVSRLISGNAAYIADSKNWPDFDNRSMSGHQTSHVFVRDAHRFFNRAEDAGVNRVFDGRGVVIADFDVDGRPDVVFIPQGAAPQILRNRFVATVETPVPPAFVGLVLEGDGVDVPKTPVGTVVEVKVAGGENASKPLSHFRELSAGNGMTSQSMHWMHIGLGTVESTTVDVTVRWTNATTQVVRNLAVGKYHRVRYRAEGAQ